MLNHRQAATVPAPADRGLVGWLMEIIRARGRQSSRPRQLELLETLPLGGKRQLMLVSCDGTRFLVGTNGDAPMTMVVFRETESCGHASVEIAGR